ncbi:hypothetical protein VE03_03262 [Pseudogymnoascus sp. 23342-1-I1]|nr:hypothetical protein VE03_03262 [Pseudogymnoascus sp. 23342-1-I1]
MPTTQKTPARATKMFDGDSKSQGAVKPWSSGRVMTKEQRARKQAVDRLAQRGKRREREARIAQLEAELAAARCSQSTNAAPPDQREEEEVQNALQFDTVVADMDIAHIIEPAVWFESQAAGLDTSGARDPAQHDPIELLSPPAFTSTDHIDQNAPAGPILSNSHYTPHTFGLASSDNLPDTSQIGEGPRHQFSCSSMINPPFGIDIFASNSDAGLQYLSTFEDGYKSQTITEGSMFGPLPIFSNTNTTTIQSYESRKTTASCNLELSKVFYMQRREVILQEQANEDFLIRAILHGWETVECQHTICPLRRTLHRIDDLLFRDSSDITRLVMLATIYKMLICQVKAESYRELPQWYRPRPTQQRFPHDHVMDYFAWPGLRERLVLSEKYVLTEDFWQKFAQSFRFHWPYGLGEAFDMDKKSGYIRFSGTFCNHLREIRYWRMDAGFLEMFPEFYDDINPAEGICPQLELPCRSICWDTEPPENGQNEGQISARSSLELNWHMNHDLVTV